MPAHDDIRGEELRPWLSQLALIDAGADQKFHLRQCGLHLIRRLGREATGYGVHELAPDIGAHLDAILKATCRVAAPVVAVSYVQLGRAFNSYTDVALPLAGAGGGIATVLLGSHPIREG